MREGLGVGGVPDCVCRVLVNTPAGCEGRNTMKLVKVLALAGTLSTACAVLSPANAFPGSRDCYQQPTPDYSTDQIITDLSVWISSSNSHTEDKACRLFTRGLLHQ